MRWSHFLVKLQETPTQVFSCKCCEIKACNFIKKRLQHKCFTVNVASFLRWLTGLKLVQLEQ